MLLDRVLPRPLDPSAGNEAVTVMNSVIGLIHLDRRASRRVGWRGVRPSFASGAAWTARVAGSDTVYGLVSESEECADGLLTGSFLLYAFPDQGQAEHLAALPEQDRAHVAAECFRGDLRELSQHARELAGFIVGRVLLDLSLDGGGAALSLEVPRERRLAPGLPALRCAALALPFFWALSDSFQYALNGERAELLNAERATIGDAPVILLTVSALFADFIGRLPGRAMKSRPFAYQPDAITLANKPVVHVLTGFLGAGKTTFLRHWLEFLNGREHYTGVIQNEFGAEDLDSLVLSGQTKVEALDDGCVCCTLAESLRPGIRRLIDSTPAEMFVLETTGVAFPSSVMGELLMLSDLVERGMLITVVDAYDLTERPELLAEGGCRAEQIDSADVLVCSKADAVPDDRLDELMAKLHQRNPQALVLPAAHGDVPFAALEKFYQSWLDRREEQRLRSRQGARGASGGILAAAGGGLLANAAPDEGFTTFCLDFSEEPTIADIKSLVEQAGPGAVRVKGLVRLRGDGWNYVHKAAGVLATEAASDTSVRRTRQDLPAAGFLVIIGRDLRQPAVAAVPGCSLRVSAVAGDAPADPDPSTQS